MKNCAIRAKGNTSLSNVKQYGNDRYSFKIEFDHYDDTLTYHGLDKLVLNNNIQDNTLMKDYLTYRMMAYMGVDAPLVSYAFITVNGEDFGLYLALEAVEESFLERNYGADYGELYKPDSISMGGGDAETAGILTCRILQTRTASISILINSVPPAMILTSLRPICQAAIILATAASPRPVPATCPI